MYIDSGWYLAKNKGFYSCIILTMAQEEVGWPTCQFCGEPMLVSRSNQKYCDNNNRCKQAAYSQRKRRAELKQVVELPTRAESILVHYINGNVAQAREIRETLRGLLGADDFAVVNRKLARIINVSTDAEVMRISALDQQQAGQDYAAYNERTDLPP